MIRAGLVALTVLAHPIAVAAAAPPPPVTEATAVWTGNGSVQLDVVWEGGACEVPGEPEVTAGAQQTDLVTIPTSATGEVCTMQIVPVEFSGIIAVEPGTESISILVLGPDGEAKASGSAEIKRR